MYFLNLLLICILFFEQVIREKFPIKLGDIKNGDYCTMTMGSARNEKIWKCKLRNMDKLNTKPMKAVSTVTNLFILIQYLENRSFDWANPMFSSKDCVHRLLIAILYTKSISMDDKMKLFQQYIKSEYHAYDLFLQITFTFFAMSGENNIE